MVGLRSEGWDRGMAVDQIQLKKPEVIRSIVDTAGSFQDLLGDITWEKSWAGSIGRKRGEERAALRYCRKVCFPIRLSDSPANVKLWNGWVHQSDVNCFPENPRSLDTWFLSADTRSPPYRVSDRAYSKTIVFPSRHPLSNPSNDSWNSRKKHYFFQWFQLVDDYVDIVGRINRYGIFNAEKRSCPRLREGNAENAIVRRLIDFAKTMPRGRNFLGFMPFLNDAGAQAHHVSPRSSTREWCARFFANENPLTGLKPSYTYIYIYIYFDSKGYIKSR